MPKVDVPPPSIPDNASIEANIHAVEDQSGGILIGYDDEGAPTVIATAQDLVGVPEVITSFRIDLSQYPDGSKLRTIRVLG